MDVLSRFDEIVSMDIYPAREQPIVGVNSDVLLELIKTTKEKFLKKLLFTIVNSEADLVLVMGAGDIGNHIQKLKQPKCN